ncbi:competence protein CoiA family protein [Psychrobacter sp. APC 3350]|uniref:competence protein CoiA n=1 Tax=Psychrobacter sp. APC 3350 TaxID=3035195 RepID=UPI0025B50EE3|nr:competence protein CoiA family protein [Psychrobacter sp. APC 3350]MDN3454523.1 competence protein CoiA family protein [Psychrobacter sp. APC 3350]
MAFSCKKDNQTIYSFQYDLKDWIALKKEKNSDFTMSCCGDLATLKTSRLGTQFFAHKIRPNSSSCSTDGESDEHMDIKRLVMQELSENGWSVEVEKRGATPNGEEWIADIYAEKGKAKIAIEVQWSPQAFIETKRRQEKYAQSGVRCAWLLRSGSIKARNAIVGDYAYSTKDLPVFSIYKNNRQDGQTYMVYNVNKLKLDSYDPLEPIALELEDFIKSLVSSRIRFIKKYSPVRRLYLKIIKQNCWNRRCGGTTKVVTRMYFKEIVFGIEIEYLFQSEAIDDCDNQMVSMLNSQFAKAYNFVPLRRRYSKTVGGSYVANSCIHCDALMGKHFIGYYNDEDPSMVKTHCINIPNKGDLIEHGESFEFGKWVLIDN